MTPEKPQPRKPKREATVDGMFKAIICQHAWRVTKIVVDGKPVQECSRCLSYQ